MLRFTCAAALAAALALPLSGQSADLTVVKSGPETSAAGTRVPYEVTVTNLGPDAAADTTLTDVIPGGMTFATAEQTAGPLANCTTPSFGDGGAITCAIASLSAGASATFVFELDIPAQTEPGTTFTNIANATSAAADPNEENDQGVASTTTPLAQADLFAVKSGPAGALPGETVTYRIEVGNAGPVAGDLAWNDTLPGTMTFTALDHFSGPTLSCTTPAIGAGGTITCSGEAFPAGQRSVYLLSGTIPDATDTPAEFTNTVVVSGTNDPNEENNVSTVTLIVSAADVTVTKSGPATATAGSVVAYTLTVRNNGPDLASNVTMSDILPSGTTLASFAQTGGRPAICTVPTAGTHGAVTCTIHELEPSQTSLFSLSVNAGAAASITNIASVSAESGDPDSTNNASSVSTTLTPSANLSVAKSGPATVDAGRNATYSITVTNSGPSAAENVALTDAVPAQTTLVSMTQTAGPTFTCDATVSCSIASLPASTTATFTLVVAVAPNASGTIGNTATVSSTTSDPTTGNESATANTTVTTSADLAVVKSGPTGVAAGTTATYDITLTNAGPSDAASVTLTDTLPPGTTFASGGQTSGPAFSCTTPAAGTAGTITCTTATFASGATAAFQFVVNVSPAATGSVANTAQVNSATADPIPSNNQSTVSATVGAVADVGVVKTGPASVPAGTNATYTITVTNNGPADAANVSLTDNAPNGTTFVSMTQTSGPTFTCGGSVSCTIATLASGASAAFELVLAVSPTATAVANTATVASSTGDSSTANNTSTANTAITPGTTDLALTKSTDATTAAPGSTVTFTLVATNNGPATAFDAIVTDPLPAGMTLLSYTATQGTCDGSTTVTCALGTLAPNASATITLLVRLPQAEGPVENTATISAANAESAPANDSGSASIAVASPEGIPALSPLMLALLAAILGGTGVVFLKR